MNPIIPFSFLGLAFLGFSFSIYLKPALSEQSLGEGNSSASEGRLVWQKYNCQSCHQLYGLGGYLGPDLTNVYSAPNKGVALIRARLKTGISPMPAFECSEEETADLIAFLKVTDASGSADPRTFITLPSGMIQRK